MYEMKEGKEWFRNLQGEQGTMAWEFVSELAPGGLVVARCEESLPIEYINTRMVKHLGYDSAEEYKNAMAGGLLQIFWPEDRAQVQQGLERQLTEGDQYAVQCRVVNHEGNPVWVHNVIRYVPGAPDCLVAVFYDIDESKQRYRQQESHLAELRAVMEHVPGGICVLLWKEGRFEPVTLGKKFCHMLGIDGNRECDRLNIANLFHIHPEDRSWVQEKFLDCIQNNEPVNLTARFRNEISEEYVWAKVEGNIVPQEDGSRLCYFSCTNVTKEKELEVKFQASEYSLNVALENCNIYSGKYDLREKVSIFNRKIQEDFGLPERVEVHGKRDANVMSDIGRQELVQLFQEMSTGKQDIKTIEMPMRKVNGEWIWTRQTYTVVEKDADGKPLLIISTALDITKQKQDEQRFNTEMAYHRLMTKNMSSVIRMSVTRWKVIDYVGEYEEAYREGQDLLEIFQNSIPDSGMREKFCNIFDQRNMILTLEAGDNKLSYTYQSKRLNGSTIWVETTADLMQRSDGEVLALILVKDVNHQVITDQVRNTLLDTFTDFVGYYNTLDGDSCIISEKPEFCFESDGETGALYKLYRDISRKVSPEEQDSIEENISIDAVQQHLKCVNNYPFIYHVQEADQETRIKRVNYYYLDQNQEIIVISQRDITDIMREEEQQRAELQSALNIANQASRARDEFLSNMSHDLRTPLNGIIGASELAMEQIQTDPGRVREYLEDIHSSGRFMLNLVGDILDMNRLLMGKQELDRTRIDWKTFAWDLQQVFEPICLQKDLKMRIDMGENIPSVTGDEVRLRRVLQNLLSNAVKFTEPGGNVECLVTETKMIGELYFVTIVVRDSGVGISEEFQKHMFEIFTQEKNRINDRKLGSGLGLAISKSLVELMGGTIQCESERGVGTTFTLSLPFERNQEQEKRPGQEQGKIELAALRGHKVLLVEDHPLNAKIVRHLLENREIVVEHAVNGQDAVEQFERSELFSFDAILMDILMPVMDGIEATRKIRAMERSDAHMIPIIALTANAFEQDVQKSKSAGMNDHLTKPLDSEKLFQTLAHYWQ